MISQHDLRAQAGQQSSSTPDPAAADAAARTVERAMDPQCAECCRGPMVLRSWIQAWIQHTNPYTLTETEGLTLIPCAGLGLYPPASLAWLAADSGIYLTLSRGTSGKKINNTRLSYNRHSQSSTFRAGRQTQWPSS